MLEQTHNCDHWGAEAGLAREGGSEAVPAHACAARGGEPVTRADCRGCLQHTRQRPLEGTLDGEPQPVQNRFGGDAGAENLYIGGQVFLVLGGPSLNDLDLDLLSRRGIVSMAVNNAAAWVRPDLWTVGDPVGKFHDSVWRDPGIVKFCPQPRLGNALRARGPDGRLAAIGLTPQECPGVYALRRNSDFDPGSWLWEPTVNWGNGKKEAARNSRPAVLSTMLQALRLCHYLGFRTVYLLGCDFTMGPRYRYAFPERRSQGAVNGCNDSYSALAKLLGMLRPEFDSAGYTVVNCFAGSGLTVFDHLPFGEAVGAACDSIEQQPDTIGWYED